MNAAAANDARADRREVLRRHRVEVELAEPSHGVDACDEQLVAPLTPERNRGLQARVFDARNGLRRLQQTLAQRDRLRAVELHAAHVEARRAAPDRRRSRAARDCTLLQAADEEARADEQHDRQRALQHEQRDARARSPVRAFARARLEIAGEVGAPGLKCRREAGQQADDERGDRGEEHRSSDRGTRPARFALV